MLEYVETIAIKMGCQSPTQGTFQVGSAMLFGSGVNFLGPLLLRLFDFGSTDRLSLGLLENWTCVLLSFSRSKI